MARGTNYVNPDGLNVGFGIHSSDNEHFAEVNRLGNRVVVQGYLVLVNLVDTWADTNYPSVVQSYSSPEGSIITRGTIQAVVAATSGTTSDMDIGTWSKGLATEVVDVTDGIQNGITDGEMTPIGEYHRLDGTMIIAPGSSSAISVGATANTACEFIASYNTVFTAGTVLVTLENQIPFGAAGATFDV